MIKTYSECLNLNKFHYMLPLIHLKYSHLLQTHLPHHTGHFLKQLWKPSFISVLCCVVVAALILCIDSNNLIFILILTLESSQESQHVRFTEKYVGVQRNVFMTLPFCWMVFGSNIHWIFYYTL